MSQQGDDKQQTAGADATSPGTVSGEVTRVDWPKADPANDNSKKLVECTRTITSLEVPKPFGSRGFLVQ
jgi:hypothetical protein